MPMMFFHTKLLSSISTSFSVSKGKRSANFLLVPIGIKILLSLKQSSKTPEPIRSTVFGIYTVSKDVHDLKAWLPISFILLLNVTDRIFMQPSNAFASR